MTSKLEDFVLEYTGVDGDIPISLGSLNVATILATKGEMLVGCFAEREGPAIRLHPFFFSDLDAVQKKNNLALLECYRDVFDVMIKTFTEIYGEGIE